MEQEVKLLVGTSLEGEDQEFFIYRNSKLGEGGFGVVRRAAEAKNQSRPLAVKIIPYGGDPVKKAKIEREVSILRVLPDHPNLVRVLPYKCFSENNFYIFMELCPDGTLTDFVRKQGLLQEQTIFSIFYQLINGYRVLEEAGIVHQDLKLGNVLVKKGVLKITDFGFSILAQNYKTSLTREGTLHYMPYQKLTDPKYVADSLSDVYSLGVIMFEVITKLHPYVNQKNIKTQKQFVVGLRSSDIVKPKLYTTYSIKLQELFELVTRMCAKTRRNRATCAEIYNYVDTNQVFAPFRDKEVEPSVELQLPPLPIKIEEISTPVFLPFLVGPEEENEYLQKLSLEKENRLQTAHTKNIQKVEHCVLGHRLVLYFFDRLARRLIVQKIKQQLSGQAAHNYNRAILSCLIFEKRVTKQLLKYIKTPGTFAADELENFRKSEIGAMCLKLIRKDENYTQQNIQDHLKRTHQVQVKQQIALLDLAQQKDIQPLLKQVNRNLKECIKQRSCNVSEKRHLITLAYLFDGCTITKEYPKVKGISLEDYFYETETMLVCELTSRVMQEFNSEQSLPMPVFMIGEEQDKSQWI